MLMMMMMLILMVVVMMRMRRVRLMMMMMMMMICATFYNSLVNTCNPPGTPYDFPSCSMGHSYASNNNV